jgi:hypothetical protein
VEWLVVMVVVVGRVAVEVAVEVVVELVALEVVVARGELVLRLVVVLV